MSNDNISIYVKNTSLPYPHAEEYVKNEGQVCKKDGFWLFFT